MVSVSTNGVSFNGSDAWEQDEKILQPVTRILKSLFTGIPAKLVQAFNKWLNVPADKLAVLQESIEMYSAGFILLDDIQDNSFMPEGIPAAHTVYGVASTISAAMYVFLISLQRVLSFDNPDMTKLNTEMMLEGWRGQAMWIYWCDNHTCPSEEEYLEMVKRSKDRVRAMSRI